MNKIIISKRGTEKPIEIFVALFVVLAVALVMLRMFKGQVSDQTANLNEIAAEEEIENQMQSAATQCNDGCSDMVNKGCSEQDKVRYCTDRIGSVSRNGLDLNKDGTIIGYDDGTFYVGKMGVCEQFVYCPMIREKCICQQEVTLDSCLLDILPTYWNVTACNTTEGNFTTAYQEFLNKSMPVGCSPGDDQETTTWYWYESDKLCP